MRLIDTSTLKLNEYFGEQIPPYAILSHVWGKEEVSFQDFQDLRIASKKRGYRKILESCRRAEKDSLQYVWVDTSCIDKTSSAELTEAINSMFSWYKNSQICYVYLEDVVMSPEARFDTTNDTPSWEKRHVSSPEFQHFKSSRWFTRGWTLQELIAPRIVQFFCHNWEFIGTKFQLAYYISATTGIDEMYLTSPTQLKSASVACKMSWLSSRNTTRREDIAYCMLGLFGINMSLLYGEGDRAYIRLQEKILKVSPDHTIFCWKWGSSVPDTWTSILAPSPDTFVNASNVVQSVVATKPSPYAMTNFGLRIELPVAQCWSYSLLMLNAASSDTHQLRKVKKGDYRLCIPVRQRPQEPGVFERVPFPPVPVPLPKWLPRVDQNIFVRTEMKLIGVENSGVYRYKSCGFLLAVQDPISFLSSSSSSYRWWSSTAKNRILCDINRAVRLETYPEDAFDATTSVFWLDCQRRRAAGMMRIGNRMKWTALLYFGVKTNKTNLQDSEMSCLVLDPKFWPEDGSSRSTILKQLDRKFRVMGEGISTPKKENVSFYSQMATTLLSPSDSVIRIVHLNDVQKDREEDPDRAEGKHDWEDELSDASVTVRIDGKQIRK